MKGSICTLSFLIGWIAFFSFSCTDTSNKANILPPDIQYSADTMFAHKRNKITKHMDSICASRDSLVIQSMVDSLVDVEQQRIRAITGE